MNTKSSAWQRGFRIGRLGFGLVGSYLGYQAQNLLLSESGKAQRRARFHKKASQQVSGELGALKGAVMKLGQLLSMQTRVFPEEALRELAALQMHAPGMHATMARAQFKASMGKFPEDVFREFDPEPLYEKARKIRPDVEEWLELFHPRGSGDIFFGRKMEPAVEKRMRAAWNRSARRIFQNKWINPEYAFLSRADMGLWFLIEQLGAVVNISEIARRVEAGRLPKRSLPERVASRRA